MNETRLFGQQKILVFYTRFNLILYTVGHSYFKNNRNPLKAK